MVQKVFGICEAKNKTETDDLPQAGADGHQRVWQHVKADSGPGGRWGLGKGGKIEMEGFMAQKGLWNLVRGKVTSLESTRLRMNKMS